MTRPDTPAAPLAAARRDRLIRIAAILALIGFACALLFLVFGFEAWSVGIGVFLGFPILLAAIGLYIVVVIRDLRRREAL